MVRNTRKMCAMGTRPAPPASGDAASLMGGRRVAVESIDHRGLGDAEGKHPDKVLLQGDLKFGRKLSGPGRNLLALGKLRLEGEFTDKRLMLAAGAPERDVALGKHAPAEIERAEGQQHFLDDAIVDNGDTLLARGLQRCECGED